MNRLVFAKAPDIPGLPISIHEVIAKLFRRDLARLAAAVDPLARTSQGLCP
jgi:hypothetical protein